MNQTQPKPKCCMIRKYWRWSTIRTTKDANKLNISFTSRDGMLPGTAVLQKILSLKKQMKIEIFRDSWQRKHRSDCERTSAHFLKTSSAINMSRSFKSNRVLVGHGPNVKEKKRKRRLSETIRETIETEKKRREREQAESETSSQTGTTEDEVGSVTSEIESTTTGVDDDTSDEDSIEQHVPLILPDSLKAVLERDYRLINERNKLVLLPAEYTALNLLEDYVKSFAICNSSKSIDKRKSETKEKEKPYIVSLDLCKEVMDGLRVIFDFHVEGLLLYEKEQAQAQQLRSSKPVYKGSCSLKFTPSTYSDLDGGQETRITLHPQGAKIRSLENEKPKEPSEDVNSKLVAGDDENNKDKDKDIKEKDSKDKDNKEKDSKEKEKDMDKDKDKDKDKEKEKDKDDSKQKAVEKVEKEDKTKESTPRRQLRSNRPLSGDSAGSTEREKNVSNVGSLTSESGRSTPTTTTSGVSGGMLNSDATITKALHTLHPYLSDWTLLPEENRQPPPPVLLYGPMHLLRLFVKLPEILFKMNTTEKKKKVILKHLDLFLEYVVDHSSDLFPESAYVPNSNL
ncbi:MSL complex subunit 3B-like isoform X2 [Oratosquilla oratoria]|uniref:MSL complex subunit 3B-like isoform X2 n=1 Tax=Oratosquilla oratoria TaxID=337810 RepID=UPI003F7581B8